VEQWQEPYLRAAENGLRRRPRDEAALKDDQIKELQQKIGELMMENDVLWEAMKPYPLARESREAGQLGTNRLSAAPGEPLGAASAAQRQAGSGEAL